VAGVGRNGRKGGKEAVEAAAEIYRRHGGFIRAVVRFQAGARFDPDDLFQEFFLVLIRKPVPPQVRRVKSYLYRALANYVFDRARQQACYERNLRKYAAQARIAINNRAARNVFIEQEEKSAALAYLTRHLQERQAQAFVLKYGDHCTLAEIAARMGVNQRTVSRYLCQGLKRLRRVLAIE
jgi:RNA polymerase sigma factor (sigma-70 family)